MVRFQLDKRRWNEIEAILALRRTADGPEMIVGSFIEAVLWWRRTGVPWRDLPEEFGPWTTVFNRFDRWPRKVCGPACLRHCKSDRDDEWHSIDSTVNRAHQHAAGAKGGAADHGIGRSRGGLSTKIHLLVDALGLPVVFEITEGQRHDSRPASTLVQRAMSNRLLADKAYDSDSFRAALNDHGCLPVIPSNRSRAKKPPFDGGRHERRGRQGARGR